jgi:CelD/BcsL family acetyltransferase involved in cellulose biosynthesis
MFAPRHASGWTGADRKGPPRIDSPHDALGGPSGSASELAVEEITDYATFLRLEREWNDTASRAAVPHPFMRHEWVRTWWDAFGAGARLNVLVVRAEGRPIAIAPLMRDTAQMYGLNARRIRFLQNDHTPRTDFIVAERPAEAFRAIWTALRQRRDQWDVLQLSQLPSDSPSHTFISGLASADSCLTGVWRSGDSPYLPLAGTWDGYLNGLPAKFRSNLRNRLSRLTRVGEPGFEVLADRDAIQQACDDVWRLEDSGWKRDAGTAISADPAVRRFYADLVDHAAAHGWMRLLFLTVGGRRIAMSYSAIFDNRLFLFKTGYDPEFAGCSPFKLLTQYAIQYAFQQGLTELDFLGDSEPWKLEWTNLARGHDWLYVFADSRRARFLHSVKFQWVPELKRWRA